MLGSAFEEGLDSTQGMMTALMAISMLIPALTTLTSTYTTTIMGNVAALAL
jgi:hypothetical protein